MQPCIQRHLLRRAAFSICPQCCLSWRNSSISQYGSVTDLSSNRSRKRRRPSPSGDLIHALDSLGLHRAIPPAPKSKPDFSYINPLAASIPRTAEGRPVGFPSSYSFTPSPASTRLHDIVTSAIQQKAASPQLPIPSEANSISSSGAGLPLTDQARRVLAARNYDSSDLDKWVSIILREDLTAAADALQRYTFSSPDGEDPPKPVPIFVLLFLLRRKPEYYSPQIIRCLLSVAQYERERRHASLSLQSGAPDGSNLIRRFRLDYPVIMKDTLFLVVLRLIRFSRYVWPEALPSIAAMFIQSFRVSNPDRLSELSRKDRKEHQVRLARLTSQCNRLLVLFSRPPSQAPFRSVVHCHAAQLTILKFMAAHNPPIIISRIGYRAVSNLHLASRKSDREREWDRLKAKSWPPWKEEKTGLDADKGVEYGLPDSLKVMRQLSQSGYPHHTWESVAKVLAGWDVDNSPTIQTRSHLLPFDPSYPTSRSAHDEDDQIWAARIRTTRTVQEAWAAFLAHKDRALPPSERIYFAMLEKLAASTLPFSGLVNDPSTILFDAGDTKEVFPIPDSPKEATYVHTPPPTLHQLANDMVFDDIYPGHRTLKLLLSNAQDLAQAIHYIQHSSKKIPEFASLLSYAPEQDPRLQLVPRGLLSAFATLLYRTSALQTREQGRPGMKAVSSEEDPSSHARRLLHAYQHKDTALYNQVMNGLLDSTGSGGMATSSADYHASALESRLVQTAARIRVFEEVEEFARQMAADGIKPDTETFRVQCRALSYLVLATQELERNRISSNYLRHSPEQLTKRIRMEYAPNVHSLFYDIFHGKSNCAALGASGGTLVLASADPRSTVPRLLAEPVPAVLHQYVRLLGHLRDFDMMLRLAQWMAKHREEIDAIVSETRGGKTMLRRCLIAFRAYTKPRWGGTIWENEEDDGWGETIVSDAGADTTTSAAQDVWGGYVTASKEVRQELKRLVETAGWEWPSDDEVESYLERPNLVGSYSRAF